MPLPPKATLLKLVDDLIAEGSKLLGTTWAQTHLGQFTIANPRSFVDLQLSAKWVAGCANFARILGSMCDPWRDRLVAGGNAQSTALARLGTLQGIKTAIEGDLLVSFENLVRAGLFDDLLEQAEHLFENGYSLAAGVLGRAVLEEHLRKWCEKQNCFPQRPKPTLNDFNGALYSAQHLDKIQMKHVEAMAAIGNDAAHNNPSLKPEDVQRLLRDVRDFLVRNPLS